MLTLTLVEGMDMRSATIAFCGVLHHLCEWSRRCLSRCGFGPSACIRHWFGRICIILMKAVFWFFAESLAWYWCVPPHQYKQPVPDTEWRAFRQWCHERCSVPVRSWPLVACAGQRRWWSYELIMWLRFTAISVWNNFWLWTSKCISFLPLHDIANWHISKWAWSCAKVQH